VGPEKIEYAVKVDNALLLKDRRRSGKITEDMKQRNTVMTIFKTFEE